MWPWSLTHDHFKFCSHLCIKIGVTVRKLSIRQFFGPYYIEIWRMILKKRTLKNGRMTLKNNRAAILRHFKLCASFRSYLLAQTGVTARKPSNWGKIGLTNVTLTFNLWPWTCAWPSLLLMIITPENVMKGENWNVTYWAGGVKRRLYISLPNINQLIFKPASLYFVVHSCI